jgi:hypothetical protein
MARQTKPQGGPSRRRCRRAALAALHKYGLVIDRMGDQQSPGRKAMTDVEEQMRHPQPVKHSDNEKSKTPLHDDAQNKPLKMPGEGEPPVE